MSQEPIEFRYCCNQTHKVEYNIKHNPRPISLMPALRESIEYLLWYVPGISSVQSYKNYLIDDILYSEAVFDIILETLRMSRTEDIKIVDENIQELDDTFYENEICTSCQKMILTCLDNKNGTRRKETVTRSMLRHLRNSIAHGSFTTVGDLVLFRDTDKGSTTAIIKINVLLLNKVLKQIEDYKGITQEAVIGKVFKKLGFNVEMKVPLGRFCADMIIKKADKAYIIEIKDINQKELEYQERFIENAISQLNRYKDSGLTPIFIYDKVKIPNRTKVHLRKEGIILLDRKNISELVRMNDII